jgi:hypothetical protein
VRSPDRLWFGASVVAALLLAALLGVAFYFNRVRATGVASLSDTAREELASLAVPARATAAIEQKWVADDGFTSELLTAPAGPQPCEQCADVVPPLERPAVLEGLAALREPDPDVRIEQLANVNDTARGNLIIGQMLATELIEAGRYPEAERVITQALDSTNADETIIAAARVSSTLDLDDVGVSNIIHLHHALGVARLSQSSSEPPWISLKNVIGSVKPLVRRRLMGTTRDQPVWSRLLIAAPGCPERGGGAKPALSTYDLYDNLIVGYMRGKFTGDDAVRAREFGRPRKTYPSKLHALLLAQVVRARQNGWQNEAQLWALSNVEQVIDFRMPDDARLALACVQVIDWWTQKGRCPAEVCTEELLGGIRSIRNELIEQAFKRRNVVPEQRTAFARSMVGLLASSTLDRARVRDAATAMRDWLAPKDRRTLDDLLAADAARSALPSWLFAPREPDAESPQAKLGARGERWYSAALTDVAAAASKWAASRPVAEQRRALIAIRQVLGTASAPSELTALEQQRSFSDRLLLRVLASKAFWAFVALLLATLVWLVLLWMLVHLREWWLLRVSLYNVELEHLRGRSEER